MAALQDFDESPGEETDERSSAVDSVWDWPDEMPARGPVDALLGFSEESSCRDQEPDEYHCVFSWEEAVEGWGKTAPLAGVFLSQRRGKKTCDRPRTEAQDSGLNKTIPSALQPRGHSQTPALCTDVWSGFRPIQTASCLAVGREKIADSSPSLHDHQSSTYSEPTSRPSDVMNSFTVLPPVRSPRAKRQVSGGQSCHQGTVPEDKPALPLTTITHTAPYPSSALGRHLRQTFHSSSGDSRRIRPEPPQLPIVCGTRVPMPVSAQRNL